MNPTELIFGLIFVIGLVAIAFYFGARQVVVLRCLRRDKSVLAADRRYLGSQALRRLFCSGIMLLLAGLLVGSYFFEPEYQHITKKAAAANDRPVKQLNFEEKGFLQRYTFYWIFTLMVLFLFLVVAVWDIRATLRFGWERHKKLRDDHRLALKEDIRRLHEERNGK